MAIPISNHFYRFLANLQKQETHHIQLESKKSPSMGGDPKLEEGCWLARWGSPQLWAMPCLVATTNSRRCRGGSGWDGVKGHPPHRPPAFQDSGPALPGQQYSTSSPGGVCRRDNGTHPVRESERTASATSLVPGGTSTNGH